MTQSLSNNQKKKLAAEAHNRARALKKLDIELGINHDAPETPSIDETEKAIHDIRQQEAESRAEGVKEISVEIEAADNLSTGARHSKMYEIAERNPHKGQYGGCCNVTQCQKPNAVHFNRGTHAFYCRSCAQDIQAHCTLEDPLFTDL